MSVNTRKSKTSQLSTYLLVSIIVVAAIFRLINLGNLPQAFFTDEAALGYNAWSLLTTLRDEYGKLLPITLRSFDDFKPAVYSYLSIPFILIFGLNQASSRMLAAVAGICLVGAVFYLVKKLSKKISLALLTAAVLAITPWHLEISRTAIEAGVAVLFSILSLAVYKKGYKNRSLVSLLFLVLTLGTYHSARIVAPLFWLGAIFTQTIKVDKKFKLAIFAVFILGLLLSATASQSRFSQISIFSDAGAKLKREEAIREDGGAISVSLLETRIVHNKLISAGRNFVSSYLTNISLQYLFLGGAQPPRATIPETGQFLLIFLPFFIIGLAVAVYQIKQAFYQWLLLCLLVAPLPAALTTAEIPNTYRTVFLLPIVAILIAQGLLTSYQLIKNYGQLIKIACLSLVFVAVSLNFYQAWHQYRVHQQVHQPWYRQYGYQELFSYLNTLTEAQNIIITNRENEPYMMYLFYNRIRPAVYQAQTQKRLSHREIEAGAKTWSLFNLTFSEAACPHDLNDTNPQHYYVVTAQCELPANFTRVKTINFLDGNPEFHIDRPITVTELNSFP